MSASPDDPVSEISLTELERRTLAHLPRWRTGPERLAVSEQLRAANGYPDAWTLPETLNSQQLADRLTVDAHVVTAGGGGQLPAGDVDELCAALAGRGLVARLDNGWAMTRAGLDALRA